MTKQKFNSTALALVLLSFVATLFLSSCSSQKPDCIMIPTLFNGKDLSVAMLSRYMRATSANTVAAPHAENAVQIYIDKSSGINEAFSSAVGGKTATDLLLEIMNNYRTAKWFSVLDTIEPFDLQGVDPSNYFVNAANYEKIDGKGADLLNALNTITERNDLAFFITDGEQFDAAKSEITSGAWATEPLKAWIAKGNTIHFWVTDYQVAARQGPLITKHLFFMAFVPAESVHQKGNTDLVKSMTAINSTHLELTNRFWKINPVTWPQQASGLDANLLKDGVFEKERYLRALDNTTGSFEFISLLLPLKKEVLTSPGALMRRQVYRDIFIDLSNNTFFDVNDMDIDVHEVGDDLNFFAQYDEIKANPPKIVTDSETSKRIIDPSSSYNCYFTLANDSPVVKDEFNYQKHRIDKPLRELFEFDRVLFRNSMSNNSANTELGFVFHKNFNDTDAALKNNEGYNVVRVDFKVAGFQERFINHTLDRFAWQSLWKPGQQNVGFAKSLEQALKSTEPQGKVVHSVFVKFIGN